MPLSDKAPLALAALGAVAIGAAMRGSKKGSSSVICSEQAPQPFLIRANYLKDPAMFQKAVEYRTRNYGYFPGFGSSSMNGKSPSANAVDTTFMGLHTKLNRRIVPVLKCVEAVIKKECGTAYKPTMLSGLRLANSYHNQEVSNHVYGIALDVDPQLNPCCGCVGHWKDDPMCSKPSTSEYDRMVMPECWVHVFERFGFYWLGHDTQLRDTMHFEFLGVPPI